MLSSEPANQGRIEIMYQVSLDYISPKRAKAKAAELLDNYSGQGAAYAWVSNDAAKSFMCCSGSSFRTTISAEIDRSIGINTRGCPGSKRRYELLIDTAQILNVIISASEAVEDIGPF